MVQRIPWLGLSVFFPPTPLGPSACERYLPPSSILRISRWGTIRVRGCSFSFPLPTPLRPSACERYLPPSSILRISRWGTIRVRGCSFSFPIPSWAFGLRAVPSPLFAPSDLPMADHRSGRGSDVICEQLVGKGCQGRCNDVSRAVTVNASLDKHRAPPFGFSHGDIRGDPISDHVHGTFAN